MKKLFISMICLIFSTSTIKAQQLTDSLIVFYNFQGDCTDNSGNNLNGTVNGPTLTNDRIGNANSAFAFDGVDDVITFPSSNKMKPTLPVSVSFWVKSNKTTGSNPVFGNNYQTTKYCGFNINIANSGIAISFGDCNGTGGGNRQTKSGILSPSFTGTWHHIVGVIRGAQDMDLYVDSVNIGGTYSGSGGAMQYSTDAGGIGNFENFGTPVFFLGSLDKFAMWHKALSKAEVKQLFEKYLDVYQKPKSSPISFYPNPASNIITISSNYSYYGNSYGLFDLTGKILHQDVIDSDLTNIDISDLSSGMYLIKIGNSSYKVFKN